MKFNFRKIASALASTAMLGSTIAVAAAANYPAPFVQNGAADVAIVYGNSLDLAAVTDISTSLSSALASGGEQTGAPASEDAYALYTSSTPLQLNNSLNSVRTTVTESSLPTVLGDTDFSGNVDAEAQFQIILGSNPRVIYAKEPSTSDDPSVGLFFGTSAANYLYNATVTFDEAVNFSHADSEGEDIMLFGERFTVSSATDGDSLVLFKSAETLFLSVGGTSSVSSQVVEIEGETYTVELIAATDDSATIRVTDSLGVSDQKEIDEAQSKKIKGVEIAVNNADESTATNVIQAELLVGANRLTFEQASEVEVGTDNTAIDGTNVNFHGSTPGAGLTQMTVQVFAEDGSNDFLSAGGEFVDPVFGSFRLVFDGLTVGLDDEDSREEISIEPSGNDKAQISFTSWEGEELSGWEFVNNESGGNPSAFLGDSEDWRLFVQEFAQINESAYAVVGNEEDGVLVELTTLNNQSDGYSSDDIVFRNVMTADTYTASITSEGVGTVNIEGNSYSLTYADNRAADNSQNVRLNFPESTAVGSVVVYPTIETAKGANLGFYEPVVVQLDNINAAGTDATQLKFPDGDGYTDVTISGVGIANGTSFNVSSTQLGVTGGANTVASTTLTVGKLTYNITATAANQTTIYLVEGNANVITPAVVLFEEEDESDVYNTVIVEVKGAGTSDNEVTISETTFSWNGDVDMKSNAYGDAGVESESSNDMYTKLDQYGTLVTTDQTNSDQHSVVISYPDEQVVAEMLIDGLVEGSSGSTTLGDVKLMDDELASSDMATKNLIVVGGSCVNSAASSLLSNAGCGASWTAATGASSGEWVIQTFANPWGPSKVATLVAGWEQGDTANAATYLTTQNPLTSVGHKLTGTTGTAATVVTQ